MQSHSTETLEGFLNSNIHYQDYKSIAEAHADRKARANGEPRRESEDTLARANRKLPRESENTLAVDVLDVPFIDYPGSPRSRGTGSRQGEQHQGGSYAGSSGSIRTSTSVASSGLTTQLSFQRNIQLQSLFQTRQPKHSIKVIVCPDGPEPYPHTLHGLKKLYDVYKVPGVFMQELFHGVTHSFGTREFRHSCSDKPEHHAWLQFLCKNITVTKDNNNIVDDPNLLIGGNEAGDDYFWIRMGYFLLWNRSEDQVTLLCFGRIKDSNLETRLEGLLNTQCNVQHILEDPYILYTLILEDAFTTIDTMVWSLMAVWRNVEKEIFDHARKDQTSRMASRPPDFVRLHNIAKHVVHLLESSEAILQSINHMQKGHERLMKGYTNGSDAAARTTGMLEYFEALSKAPNLRLKSIEKRVNNAINLAFNLVTQQDSSAMQIDSRRMIVIAFMTFFFLPGTAIATMFGTAFFKYEISPQGKEQFTVSKRFWMFWVLTFITTAATMAFWAVYTKIEVRSIHHPNENQGRVLAFGRFEIFRRPTRALTNGLMRLVERHSPLQVGAEGVEMQNLPPGEQPGGLQGP